MMIAPKSLARRKEGAQGEEEEEAGDRRKGGSYDSIKCAILLSTTSRTLLLKIKFLTKPNFSCMVI